MTHRRPEPPVWHPHDGRSTYATQLFGAEQLDLEQVASVARRADVEMRRLGPLVDELVARATVPTATADDAWALSRRIEVLEMREQERGWGLVLAMLAMVAWSGILTAIMVVVSLG